MPLKKLKTVKDFNNNHKFNSTFKKVIDEDFYLTYNSFIRSTHQVVEKAKKKFLKYFSQMLDNLDEDDI